jgi:hypothetical protein
MQTPTVFQGMRALSTAGRLYGAQGLYAVLRTKLYWRAQFVRFKVDLAQWPERSRPREGVEAREGTFDELNRFRESHPQAPIQFYADRTHGGHRFYLGLCDGRIGHISWVYDESDRVRQMRLQAGEIMLEGAFTFSDFRGRGLLAAVECAALDDARREGKRAAYTHVSVDNRASLRGVWKTGFRPVGLLTWRWVCGMSVTSYLDSAQLAASAAGLPATEAIAHA